MSILAARAPLALAVAGTEKGSEAASPLAALAERARDGDAGAFDRLMLETQERVISVAWRMLGNREDALDAAQETYVRVYRSLGRFRAGEDLMGWIYRIAVNVCRDAARKRRRSPIVAAEAPEIGVGSRTEEALLWRQRRLLVREALSALPPRERAALILRDMEGLTSEEAARVLGTRPGTIRAQIAAARKKIRDHCQRVFEATGGGR